MNDQFDLSPADWATLRRLLDEALDRLPQERATWLHTLDAQFDAFKPRLRALLAHAAQGAGLLPLDTLPKVETAQFLADRARVPGDEPLQPGADVGPYRLIRPLGEGGMGEVWLAERTDMLHRRQVALKLPRLVTGRAALAERMAREREILATLAHPNIARLYDAGLTPTGQPYLALEYVEGERIDAYCQRKALDVQARLRLVQQVARAVAHAHANLVVHRDLKPANILVTETGEVRLLDFGIAKLLDAGRAQETELTQLAGRALTPDYAAPEQILGQPIGTAADVYALGVVLFELLTGQRPYKLKRDSRAALEEAIEQADARRPSEATSDASLRRALRGDPDAIVLQAMRREPAARYPTALALADDIERFLQRRPVVARPDGLAYRLHKFIARNSVAVGFTAVALVAVLGGLGVALVQAQRAISEKQRAEAVKDFVAAIFRDANPYQQGFGRPLTGIELLELAREALAARAAGDERTQVELLGLLAAGMTALDDPRRAEKTIEPAARLAEQSWGPDAPATLRTQVLLAETLTAQQRSDEARALLERVLPRLRALRDPQPAELALALRLLATLAFRATRFDEAHKLVSEAIDVLGPQAEAAQRVSSLILLGRIHQVQGRPDEMLRAARAALDTSIAAFGERPSHPSITDARYLYAFSLANLGRPMEAVEEVRSVLAETAAAFGADSRRYAQRLGATGEIFSEAGFFHEATANTKRAWELLAEKVPAESMLAFARWEVVALAQLAARQADAAVTSFSQAIDGYRRLLGETNVAVLTSTRNRSLALAYAGRLDESAADMRFVRQHLPALIKDGYDANAWIAGVRARLGEDAAQAIALQEASLRSMPDGPYTLPRARALTELGLSRLALGEPGAARDALSQALDLFEKRATRMTPEHADALTGQARIDLAEGRAGAALEKLKRADALWSELDADSRWAGETAYWLSLAHTALGDASAARIAADRARRALSRSPLPSDRALAKRIRVG